MTYRRKKLKKIIQFWGRRFQNYIIIINTKFEYPTTYLSHYETQTHVHLSRVASQNTFSDD